MNITINGNTIKRKTWILLGIIAAGSASTQFAAVNNVLRLYPHLAPFCEIAIAGIALLHNPVVDQELLDQAAPKS